VVHPDSMVFLQPSSLQDVNTDIANVWNVSLACAARTPRGLCVLLVLIYFSFFTKRLSKKNSGFTGRVFNQIFTMW